MRLFTTLHNYKKNYLAKDLIAGVVMAAVSIPIAMGYAEVSGLPAVYGLYGSVLPILLFACFSTSPQFIFGVDAAPAAIVGASVSSLGIAFGSAEAIDYISMIALCTGLWLLLFYVLKAGKMVDFISTPVMGGFCQRHCCDNHFDANTKGTWCFLRNRGASGTIAPFMENYASREWDVSSIGVCFFADHCNKP